MSERKESCAPAAQETTTPGSGDLAGGNELLQRSVTIDERPLNAKVVLCWALLGSLIGWVVMLRSYPFYTIYSPAPNAPAAPRGPRELDKEETLIWNMRLGYCVYGAAVGAGLGIGFTFLRYSIVAVLGSMLVSGGLGGLAGFFGGDLANSFFEKIGRTAETNVILQTMVGQGIAWVLCGISFGIGLALFSPGWNKRLYAILSGVVSGVLAGALHAPINASIFGENDINLRLPLGVASQLVWLALPATCAALVMAGLTDSKKPHTAS